MASSGRQSTAPTIIDKLGGKFQHCHRGGRVRHPHQRPQPAANQRQGHHLVHELGCHQPVRGRSRRQPNLRARLLYLQANPLLPVNGGSNADGNLAGIGYDNFNYGVLPFRANYAFYLKDSYQQGLKADGNGNWTSNSASIASFFNSGSGVREIAIPWSALGGRPASFNWLDSLDYQTGGNGVVYGPVPATESNTTGAGPGSAGHLEGSMGNQIGQVGTSGVAVRYYTVSNAANGTATAPFSQESYTFPGTGDQKIVPNDETLFDLTMNAAGQQLSQGCAAKSLAITGTAVVQAGTFFFGSNGSPTVPCGSPGYGPSTLANINVLGGSLNMDVTNQPLNVSGNVQVSGGELTMSNTTALLVIAGNLQLSGPGKLTLSNASGGDLKLAGNLALDGPANFTANGRALFLTGNAAQALTGTGTVTLPYLFVQQGSGGSTTLGFNTLIPNGTINGVVDFTSTAGGNLSTGPYLIDLGTAGALVGEQRTHYLVGNVRSTRTVGGGGSGAITFGDANGNGADGLGFTLTPQAGSNALGATTVTRTTGTYLQGANNSSPTGPNPSQSISRTYRIVPGSATGPLAMQLGYRYYGTATTPNELNNILESRLALFRSENPLPGVSWTPSGPTTFAAGTYPALSSATAMVTDFGSGSGITYGLGDTADPLPVQLVSFGAVRTASSAVRLSWVTASEVNNLGFGIERQTTAGTWQLLGFVPGAGGSLGHAYTTTDAAAPATALYYRLRQTDADGTVAYSPVATVAALGSPGDGLRLYPVPASNTLTVDLSGLASGPHTLAVYDLTGRVLLRATAEAEAVTATLSVGSLAAGAYVVRVSDGAGSSYARFVKE